MLLIGRLAKNLAATLRQRVASNDNLGLVQIDYPARGKLTDHVGRLAQGQFTDQSSRASGAADTTFYRLVRNDNIDLIASTDEQLPPLWRTAGQ